MRMRGAVAAFCLAICFATAPAVAQWTPPGGGTVVPQNVREGSELYRASAGQTFSLPAVEFGDSWSHDTGEVKFQVNDVGVPGNSSLPLVVTRSRSRDGISLRSDGMFGDWELDLPRIEYTWGGPPTVFEPTRCTNNLPPYSFISYNTTFYSVSMYNGMRIFDFSNQPHVILKPDSRWPTTPLGVAPALTTKTLWKISCLPAAVNGRDGFVATSPEGTTFRFDKEVHRRQIREGSDGNLFQVSIYPSVVTDAHGNTITYVYGAHGPTHIQASDGRIVDIAYNVGGQITSVTTNSRVWQYFYQTRNGRPFLHRVQQPDGKEWRYEGFENLDWANYLDRDYLDCQVLTFNASFPRPSTPLSGISVISPNGARLETKFSLVINGRTNGPQRTSDNHWYLNRCRQGIEYNDNYIASIAVSEKKIIQASGQIDVWRYVYAQDKGSFAGNNTLPDNKLRTEILPDGSRREYDVYRVSNTFREGEVVETRVYDASSGGNIVERASSTYSSTLHSVGYPQVQLTPTSSSGPIGMAIARESFVPLVASSTLQRSGDSFTTSYSYTLSGAGYASSQPTTIQKSSNTSSATRTSTIAYQHQVGSWVLLRPVLENVNGSEVIRLSYSTKGQVTEMRSFGALRTSIGWNPDGTMAWAKDALNRQTSYASYKRGKPQVVTQPDGGTYSFVVDNNGWVTSATNPRGNNTLLGYNPMGWITAVDRPAGWADTSFTYSWDPTGITVTETTGSKRTVTSHDGLNRPVLVRSDDLTGVAASVFQKTGYDGLGRVTFKGFPAASSTATSGATIAYDALGREISATENVAPFAATATAYLSGNRTRVTDPSGNQSTTTKVGFAGPDDGYITRIDQPLGVSTVMIYDGLGNLLTATQGDGSVSFTQTWVYDSQARLCAHTTPETGTKRFEYDAADQLIAYAEGLTGTACAALPANKVQLTYDTMGRNTTVDFPGTTPDITKAYDANGNVTSVSRPGVNWTYAYNTLDLLGQERLDIDGRTYQFDYTYNGNGHLASATVPFAGGVSFAPDGFGRSTGLNIAGNQIANQGEYFPNGDLRRMSYGNGYVYTAVQNARLLTESAQAVSGSLSALNRVYGYDANGRITTIADYAVAGENRAFTYDGLGRLATANGPWGAGAYGYDAVGNLRSWTQGTATHSTVWNMVRNQPTSATTTGRGTRSIAHDARGNVTALGELSFAYDETNQPVVVSGATSGTYVYDGNLKRVKQIVGGKTIYNVYSVLTGKVSIVDNATTNERNVMIDAGAASVRWNPVSGAEVTHLDHLGSPVASTDWSGGLLWRESYTPFGDRRSDPVANRDKPSFTGHIDDDATGLTYMQARYYDPTLGRFLSSDPVGFIQGGVNYFNPYAYLSNDPINKIDPTGMYQCINNPTQCAAFEEALKHAEQIAANPDSNLSKKERAALSSEIKQIRDDDAYFIAFDDPDKIYADSGGDAYTDVTSDGQTVVTVLPDVFDKIFEEYSKIEPGFSAKDARAALVIHEGGHRTQFRSGMTIESYSMDRSKYEREARAKENLIFKGTGSKPRCSLGAGSC